MHAHDISKDKNTLPPNCNPVSNGLYATIQATVYMQPSYFATLQLTCHALPRDGCGSLNLERHTMQPLYLATINLTCHAPPRDGLRFPPSRKSNDFYYATVMKLFI